MDLPTVLKATLSSATQIAAAAPRTAAAATSTAPAATAATTSTSATVNPSDFTPRSSSRSSVSSSQRVSSHTAAPSHGHRMTDISHSVASPLVDISAIADAMKMSSSPEQRCGCAKGHLDEVQQHAKTESLPKSKAQAQASGYQVLHEPTWNKGLSFTPEDRITKNLIGLLPHVIESLDLQCARALRMIRSRPTDLDRYLYLSQIKSQNTDLFYRLLIDNFAELMPLVYTPTIGDVCLQYSTLYVRPEALYISVRQRSSIRTMLKNWPYPDPDICVVTDGSRILGLGDLGVNGVGISIGKLSLYTAAAGIHPEKTLPIVLDCGTANEDFRNDPFYLGLRLKRPQLLDQEEFMDEFMAAAAEVYPEMLIQFEDFESQKAFNYLEKYREHYRCFNDDIQGTGAVVLAGYMSAVNLSNVPLEEQRLVFMGAGSAGVGVAKQLVEYYTRLGVLESTAVAKFWLVDTKGLVTRDRGDKLAEHKKFFAREDNDGRQFRTLEEVIEYVKPTALVGLTATFGLFTEPVVRALKASVDSGGANRRSILFPLSNPLSKAECTFEQAIQWTDGTTIFASGSPFSPITLKLDKAASDQAVTYLPNQGNNVYVFPGLGLGAILAKANCVTDDMIYASAAALAASLTDEELQSGLIYPRVERVREASIQVARAVMKAARREDVSTLSDEQWHQWEEWGDVALTSYIVQRMYDPTCFADVRGKRNS